MPIATLKTVSEKFGISLDAPVHYSFKAKQGIIEIRLTASDKEIELANVNDTGEDFLTKEELHYYLNLKD